MNETEGAMQSLNVWGVTLVNAMSALWTKVAGFVPNFLAFLVILLVGYFISKLVAAVVHKLLKAVKVDKFSERIGVQGVLFRANVETEVSLIFKSIIFWLLMLTFIVSGTESLGLSRVSATIDSFVLYLPKVLGAAFILMIGLFIAQFVRDLVVSGAEGFGIDFAGSLGSAVYGLLIIIVVTLAVGQLELETAILNQVISIVLISVGAAAALAFGIGSREVAGSILAGSYIRELYREGEKITVDEVTGKVTRITAIKTEIETDSGELITIANQRMAEEPVKKLS